MHNELSVLHRRNYVYKTLLYQADSLLQHNDYYLDTDSRSRRLTQNKLKSVQKKRLKIRRWWGLLCQDVVFHIKPVEPSILLARVSTHLKLVDRDTTVIEGLLTLMRAAKLKDNETANHTLRVAMIAYLIARYLEYDLITARHLFLIAPLHDIGKIGVRDEILLFPGNLREHPEMWQKMKAHTLHGADIIGTGIRSDIMRMAYNVARFHHEKLDGSGYPDKLKGDAIPNEALITSVADMIDAMLGPTRPYRDAPIPENRVQEFLSEDRGAKIPEKMIDAALTLWDKIMMIQSVFPNDSPIPFDKFSYLSPEELGKQIFSIINPNDKKQNLYDHLNG